MKYQYSRTHSDRDRLRERAWHLVKEAIREGKLPHPTQLQCVDCDNPAWCYEHRDYRKPLEVEPICQGCNNRRGPALPAISDSDGLWTKRPEIAGVINTGKAWGALESGEGYAPLESVCHVDVRDYECWWLDDGRTANGFDRDAAGHRWRSINDRWQFFKRHDPYWVPDIWDAA